MEFKLNSEFIELDNLLKRTDLAASGAQAKQIIRDGLVQVNGAVENRVRRKLRINDSVVFGEHTIAIV